MRRRLPRRPGSRAARAPGLRAGRLGVVALCGLALAAAGGAEAQQPFRTVEPFYQGEQARRDFYSGIAVSGEVSYRGTDLLQPAGEAAGAPVALALRLDYALLPQVDLSAVLDLSGGIGRGPTGLSWVVVKPYWHNDRTDYAVRLAIDPASEGGLGFRQTDVSFLSTRTLSPTVTSDFAIGVRRVRTGYDTRIEPDALGDEAFFGFAGAAAEPERVRVIGRELHALWGYNALFDLGGSSVSLALLGQAGDYTLVRTTPVAPPDGETPREERVQSGTGWLRGALEFSRPSYQIAPYASVPVATWGLVRGEAVRYGPRPDRARLGVRLTLR